VEERPREGEAPRDWQGERPGKRGEEGQTRTEGELLDRKCEEMNKSSGDSEVADGDKPVGMEEGFDRTLGEAEGAVGRAK